jgi:hypothetical protein
MSQINFVYVQFLHCGNKKDLRLREDDKEGVRGWRWWLLVRKCCKHRLRLGNLFGRNTQFLEDTDGIGLAFCLACIEKMFTEGFVPFVCDDFRSDGGG